MDGIFFPFVPLDDDNITYNTKEMAQVKRVSGEELSKPCDADENVWQIIKKACAHNQKDRYANVDDLKLDLYNLLKCIGDEDTVLLDINRSKNKKKIKGYYLYNSLTYEPELTAVRADEGYGYIDKAGNIISLNYVDMEK